MDLINSGGSAIELPTDLVYAVLSIAAEQGSWSERRNILSLSNDIYNFVARVVYRLIHVASPMDPDGFAQPESFERFITWMDSKTPGFLGSTVKGLNIIQSRSLGPDPDVWRRIFANMHGLEWLYVFCASWENASLFSAWNGILALPVLKSLRLDWHFNKFTILSPGPSWCCALQSVTHLSIVGNQSRSFDLADIRQFNCLTHLAVINPDLGYNKDEIGGFYNGLIGLEVLVMVVFGGFSATKFRQHFYGMRRLVVLEQMETEYQEFRNHVNGGQTIWMRAEDLIRWRDGINE